MNRGTDRIVLTGMMGAGKSAAGRLLAVRLAVPFVDLDERIVEGEGRSIASIFEDDGEARFRALETEALRAVTRAGEGVLATGGGVVHSAENRSLMKEWGRVIYLKASPGSLASRLDDDERAARPLLSDADPVARLESILAERAVLYEEADQVVETDRLTLDQVVDRILRTPA